VARAARATNAHYVDGGGDDPVYDLLMGDGDEQAAVLSAGMLPGLTGLLPRALAASELDEPSRMTGYVGGRDRFTFTAATDYLASLQNGFGRSSAVWRNGQRVERALTPLVDAQLPFFPEPVAAYPYLSTEMERLARRLRLAELTFFNVFPSSHVRATLNELASAEPITNAGALVAASELDLFGREPYQRLVFQLDGSGHDQADAPTMVLSGRSASQLTGAMVALAAVAVLEGRVPPGVHFAADVLDPAWGVARLREAGAVLALDVFNGSPPGSGQLEEGVL
jgi:hypothetical protein